MVSKTFARRNNCGSRGKEETEGRRKEEKQRRTAGFNVSLDKVEKNDENKAAWRGGTVAKWFRALVL